MNSCLKNLSLSNNYQFKYNYWTIIIVSYNYIQKFVRMILLIRENMLEEEKERYVSQINKLKQYIKTALNY